MTFSTATGIHKVSGAAGDQTHRFTHEASVSAASLVVTAGYLSVD